MKTNTYSIRKINLALFAFLITTISYGTNYTATSSGNFSSTATWAGGVVPPSSVLLDQVTISSGVNVNLDTDISLDGILSQLDVEGTLYTTNHSILAVNLGTLTGAGGIALDTININTGSTFSFTGSLVANTLNAATGFSSSANIMVNQTLNLTSGTLSLVSGGSLDAGNNGNIVISGGLLSVGSGGSIGFTGNYNVTYTNGSSTAGVELTGSGLKNVTIDVNVVSSVTLSSDLTVSGTLSLTSGVLVLSGYDLTVSGAVASSGSGSISSTSSSNVTINTSTGTAGTLDFSGTVNNFTVSVGSANKANISGSLSVNGTLQLNSGTLNFSNTDFTISGQITGSGYLYGNSSSDLTINTSGGLTAGLKFAANGQTVNNLSLDLGTENSVSLASGLTINGTLDLNNGSIVNLSSDSLTLGASSSISGSGYITATTSSTLTVNSTVGVSSLIVVGKIKNLIVNCGNGIVTLGGNVEVNAMLYLQSGTLSLNSYDLKLNGDINANGTGVIASTSSSDIIITTATSTTGSLKFATDQNTIGNLKVDITDNGSVKIKTDLNISDSLKFTHGKVDIDSNALVIGNTGTVYGAGSSSYVITDSTGYLSRYVVASSGTDSVNFPVGTASHFAPANIHLNTGTPNGQVQVGVMGKVWSHGGADLSEAQSMVAATWEISSSIVANLNMDIQVMWSASMEVNGFNRHASFLSHYSNLYWDTLATSDALTVSGMYSHKRTGLTSLSPFAVFDNNTTTAVVAVTNSTQFEVYPNPATDNITIQNTADFAEPMNVEIYNSTGRLVGTYKLTDFSSTISVNHLVTGNYFVKFYNTKTSSVKRFAKF